MPRRGTWVFAPDSGGKRIPEPVKVRTEQQRKRRAYQRAYYQRRKATRQQPAAPAED